VFDCIKSVLHWEVNNLLKGNGTGNLVGHAVTAHANRYLAFTEIFCNK